MKNLLIILVIITIIALSFIYPHMMFNPGKLVHGHQDIKNNCLACHQPFWGINDQKCIGCHKLSEIGKKNPLSASIINSEEKILFHEKLKNQECTACHTDHKGINPQTSISKFDHSMIAGMNMNDCSSCHTKPADSFHASLKENCIKCHTTSLWKPATFDHSAWFILDNDHNTDCKTCHITSNFKAYTCYGCHEHSESKMYEEHSEEGISNISDCISCHKSANKNEIKSRENINENRNKNENDNVKKKKESGEDDD